MNLHLNKEVKGISIFVEPYRIDCNNLDSLIEAMRSPLVLPAIPIVNLYPQKPCSDFSIAGSRELDKKVTFEIKKYHDENSFPLLQQNEDGELPAGRSQATHNFLMKLNKQKNKR